ncbi:N-carbamoylputrescine amidase [Richelia intracellularis HH01]|uniref:N-carbamoylputrescine amidase n=1 Tax=Richelia intracellularis HH01 TaxID=1165094 RepID=M1WXG7_9NOST|nr:nitrilase-related carbon-nitrogen hydrolase [Richelia intracellularis]CCH66322.1 N-carbamoylputrescine amidase [Richelia intracellularis HH01]
MKLGILQGSFSKTTEDNIIKMSHAIRKAAQEGAQIVLMPELFANHYFPQTEQMENFALARSKNENFFLKFFQKLAGELQVVLPVSFFERDRTSYFNSVVVFDANGKDLGTYRKAHIPDGPWYEEKYYFTPGDTGFRCYNTLYGNIGVGICWDQWFPECARAMSLMGASLLLYPSAIGSEPQSSITTDTSAMWRRVMVGHAVSNSVYVGASNRVGREREIDFYGTSFIADYQGEIIADAGSNDDCVITADLNFTDQREFQADMGFFRDRRPDLYSSLLSR